MKPRLVTIQHTPGSGKWPIAFIEVYDDEGRPSATVGLTTAQTRKLGELVREAADLMEREEKRPWADGVGIS